MVGHENILKWKIGCMYQGKTKPYWIRIKIFVTRMHRKLRDLLLANTVVMNWLQVYCQHVLRVVLWINEYAYVNWIFDVFLLFIIIVVILFQPKWRKTKGRRDVAFHFHDCDQRYDVWFLRGENQIRDRSRSWSVLRWSKNHKRSLIRLKSILGSNDNNNFIF